MAMRYASVGLVITVIDYAVFIVLVYLGLAAVQANAVGRVITTVVGAILHRRYTFAGPQKWGIARQMMAYVALSAFNLVLSSGLILLLTERAGLIPLMAKVATDVVVIAVSVLAGRFLIFAPASPPSAEAPDNRPQ